MNFEMEELDAKVSVGVEGRITVTMTAPNSITTPDTSRIGLPRDIAVSEACNLDTREILQTLDGLVLRHRQLLRPSMRGEFELSEADHCWTSPALLMSPREGNEDLYEIWINVFFLCALLHDRGELQLATLGELMLAQIGATEFYSNDKPEGYPAWFTEDWENYGDVCGAEMDRRREAAGIQDGM